MKISRYETADKAAWDAHIDSAKNGHFMHRRDYMDYHADRFSDSSFLFRDDSDSLLAVLPASRHEDVLYSHQGLTFGGLVTQKDMRAATVLALFEAFIPTLREQGIKRFVYKAIPHIYHQAPSDEDEYALFRCGARLFRADISTTIDSTCLLPVSSLRKRGAKKAEKAGVTLRPTDDFSAFHAILRGILEDKYDARVTHSREEMTLLAGRFPNNIKLHAAYLGDEMAAGVLVFETATVAHAQYIGASPAGREAGALDLLFLHLINEVYAAKRYFDFGISTEQAGQHLNENLIAQKEGFGGRGVVHRFYELNL